MISLKNTLNAIGTKISEINSSLGNVPHRTLLWTNPNPTSAFSAQTISIDLSGYDEIEIWHSEESASMLIMSRGIVGYSTELMGFRNDPYVEQRRTVTTTQNSVRFDACALGTQLGGYYGIFNDRNIPQKIYGIKYGGGTT